MEDAVVDGLSDRGSTPLRSMEKEACEFTRRPLFLWTGGVSDSVGRENTGFWTGVLLSGGERLGPTEPGGETARGPVDLGSAPTVAKRRPTPRGFFIAM